LGYAGVAVCVYGFGYSTGLLIIYVYTVGWIVFYVGAVIYGGGFYPIYCMIYYYFCLIFAFGANMFLIALPYCINYVCVFLIV